MSGGFNPSNGGFVHETAGGGGVDAASAVQVDVDAEINGLSEKVSPVGADILLLEDSAASYAKKKLQITNMPAASSADAILVDCRKGSAGTIAKGAPVYVDGYNVGGWLEVEEADCDDATTMPAFGLANGSITNAATGQVMMSGTMTAVDTSSWSVGDELWISTTAGTLTNTKPSGIDEAIQKMAVVSRSHASNGTMVVFGAGRSNDIPNYPQVTLTSAATVTPTKSTDGTKWLLTAGENLTIANPSGFSAGDGGVLVLNPVTYTISWGASWAYTAGTAPVLTASQKSVLSWYYDGTLFHLGHVDNSQAIT